MCPHILVESGSQHPKISRNRKQSNSRVVLENDPGTQRKGKAGGEAGGDQHTSEHTTLHVPVHYQSYLLEVHAYQFESAHTVGL